MGIDHTSKQHKRSSHRTAPKSDNVYLKLLVKLYAFLARMSDNYISNDGIRREKEKKGSYSLRSYQLRWYGRNFNYLFSNENKIKQGNRKEVASAKCIASMHLDIRRPWCRGSASIGSVGIRSIERDRYFFTHWDQCVSFQRTEMGYQCVLSVLRKQVSRIFF